VLGRIFLFDQVLSSKELEPDMSPGLRRVATCPAPPAFRAALITLAGRSFIGLAGHVHSTVHEDRIEVGQSSACSSVMAL
jgi:hypothetical protein